MGGGVAEGWSVCGDFNYPARNAGLHTQTHTHKHAYPTHNIPTVDIRVHQHIIYNVYVMSAHHHQHQHHAPVCLTRLRACSGFWLRKIDTLRACAICVCVCVHQTTSDVAGEIQKWFSVNKYAESVQMINSTQLRPEPLRRHKFDFPNPCVTLYCIYARTHTYHIERPHDLSHLAAATKKQATPIYGVVIFEWYAKH